MADKETKGQGQYSSRELELIQELVKTRKESGKELVYEQLDDYEVPPRQQFPMTKKPTLTIRYGKMYCNMAAIRLFEGIQYVIPMISRNKRRVAMCPCSEEESGSVEWSRQRKKDGKWMNKDINCPDVVEKIYSFMGWERECRYQIYGELRNSKEGLILVFELDEFKMPNREEFVDPETGDVKKREVKYYPDYYRNRIGRSYNDYVQAKQMSLFEDTEAYASLEQVAEEEDVTTAEGEVNVEAESYQQGALITENMENYEYGQQRSLPREGMSYYEGDEA